MDWKEVIEKLKYLISEDCTDTQFDYSDEIEIAIRVMESQEDLRSKIDKAIKEIKGQFYVLLKDETSIEELWWNNALEKTLEIIKRNIGE